MDESAYQAIQEKISIYAVNAVKGFLRAISLGTKRWASGVMQDMLSALNVWFRYGKISSVHTELDLGLSTVHLDNWLGVLPQLIARIDHSEPKARKLLHSLLTRIGKCISVNITAITTNTHIQTHTHTHTYITGERHSQAMVYPLWVALKSPKRERRKAAEELIESLRSHSSRVIDQATLVSQELVRVAILWVSLIVVSVVSTISVTITYIRLLY
jgi:FKBP12-rapamycin complex-associated protein